MIEVALVPVAEWQMVKRVIVSIHRNHGGGFEMGLESVGQRGLTGPGWTADADESARSHAMTSSVRDRRGIDWPRECLQDIRAARVSRRVLGEYISATRLAA